MSEPINDLLSQAEEIFASGKGTKAELARYAGTTPSQVNAWFAENKHKRNPNGNHTIRIQEWVKAKKKLRVKRAAFLPSTGHINE